MADIRRTSSTGSLHGARGQQTLTGLPDSTGTIGISSRRIGGHNFRVDAAQSGSHDEVAQDRNIDKRRVRTPLVEEDIPGGKLSEESRALAASTLQNLFGTAEQEWTGGLYGTMERTQLKLSDGRTLVGRTAKSLPYWKARFKKLSEYEAKVAEIKAEMAPSAERMAAHARRLDIDLNSLSIGDTRLETAMETRAVTLLEGFITKHPDMLAKVPSLRSTSAGDVRIADCQKTLDGLRHEHNTSAATLENLKSALSDVSRETLELRQDLEDGLARNVSLRTKLETSDEKLRQTKHQAQAANDRCRELEEKLLRLQQDNERLSKDKATMILEQSQQAQGTYADVARRWPEPMGSTVESRWLKAARIIEAGWVNGHAWKELSMTTVHGLMPECVGGRDLLTQVVSFMTSDRAQDAAGTLSMLFIVELSVGLCSPQERLWSVALLAAYAVERVDSSTRGEERHDFISTMVMWWLLEFLCIYLHGSEPRSDIESLVRELEEGGLLDGESLLCEAFERRLRCILKGWQPLLSDKLVELVAERDCGFDADGTCLFTDQGKLLAVSGTEVIYIQEHEFSMRQSHGSDGVIEGFFMDCNMDIPILGGWQSPIWSSEECSVLCSKVPQLYDLIENC